VDKQRLLELAGITEAKYDGDFLGTVSNSFAVESRDTANMIAHVLRRPKIGWHTDVKEEGNMYRVTLTINVNRDNLQ
jgi:hypothetical protein